MGSNLYIGIDIGGTTSASSVMDEGGQLYARDEFETTKGENGWQPTVERLKSAVSRYLEVSEAEAIGISSGGPLNRNTGVILSPPNLPGWDEVPIVEIIQDEFHLPVCLENDANAGVLAEWKYGSGKGYRNLIFLTFGTGLGAGLILDGRLYTGTNDLAGEAGHVRLAEDGPLGYHKRGSFEGFCSGPGLAALMADELLSLANEIGEAAVLDRYKPMAEVTGKDVVEWALTGDPLATKAVIESGTQLGKGLSVMIDILNPEIVVVGGMGVRLGDLLLNPAREVISREALPAAAEVCKVVPAMLGEQIGDYAALCVALAGIKKL
ncbi:MAG: ROK family protein [Fidelibacterota bacterium]|nr:MAG: ROK family protein [Candidatus Neomarinimicrobiota bacterium]